MDEYMGGASFSITIIIYGLLLLLFYFVSLHAAGQTRRGQRRPRWMERLIVRVTTIILIVRTQLLS